MLNVYFDCHGNKLELGKKLGSGGEGAVFDIDKAGSNQVGKIYHHELNEHQQQKLQAMVALASDSLRAITAWPEQLIINRNGKAAGFTMRKLSGYQPIHHLYSPAHRKQSFSDKQWDFLIHTARNISAAFHVLHQANIVIGDVNPNSVFVNKDGIVKLIDCDSFQFALDNNQFYCEVGVPYFTSPELQGISLKHLLRTTNHDNFGLALLIFLLLFQGRHPYSGVYAEEHSVISLDNAIKQNLYAYSSKNYILVKPPYNALDIGMVPAELRGMFNAAFKDNSARPHAESWLKELKNLSQNLKVCKDNSAHKFSILLTFCPWCRHEQKFGNAFFLSHVHTLENTNAFAFDLNNVMARVNSVLSPGPAPPLIFHAHESFTVPLKPEFEHAIRLERARFIAAFITILCGITFGFQYSPLVILISLPLLLFEDKSLKAYRANLKSEIATAIRSIQNLEKRWLKEASVDIFNDILTEIDKRKDEYIHLPARLKLEKQKLYRNLRQTQLKKYLAGFYISDFDIPGIGRSRKVALNSFGIETAEDAYWNNIYAVKGFGGALTRELIKWRKTLENNFVFDRSRGVDPADIEVLNQKYNHYKSNLEQNLLSSPGQLENLKFQILSSRAEIGRLLDMSHLRLKKKESELRKIAKFYF